MRVFKVLDDKSIIKLKNGPLFGPLFLVRFPYIIIWGKMGYFKVLDDKSIVKADFC